MSEKLNPEELTAVKQLQETMNSVWNNLEFLKTHDWPKEVDCLLIAADRRRLVADIEQVGDAFGFDSVQGLFGPAKPAEDPVTLPSPEKKQIPVVTLPASVPVRLSRRELAVLVTALLYVQSRLLDVNRVLGAPEMPGQLYLSDSLDSYAAALKSAEVYDLRVKLNSAGQP